MDHPETVAIPQERRLRFFLWPPPEPELAHAGRAGEIVIAKARLLVLALLVLPSTASWIRNPESPSGWLSMVTALVCIGIAAAILYRARSGGIAATAPLVLTVLDITLISAFHALLILAGEIDMVLNSRVTFALYLLAIVGAALRYNGQLVRVAGALATIQYLAIVAWIDFSDRAALPANTFYGDASLAGQGEEVSLLLMATVLGAILVERSRELRLSGIRDPLTKLANRSYFAERFSAELQRSLHARQPVALAMIDIDHFKQVNDTHGHAAGDRVLRFIAAELRKFARNDEVVARLGGEEFLVLLPNTAADAARSRLEVLRETLRTKQVDLGNGVAVSVTVSVGVAGAPVDGAQTGELLATADRRMLAGKRAGRDVVVSVG
jgi:diguanylate cyclase (GGDEF)-like protein